MGPLEHIKTTVPSAKGNIRLELHNQPKSFKMDIKAPKGADAIIGVPKRPGADISGININGKKVWKSGELMGGCKGVTFLENSEHYIKFSVQPGNWSLEAVFVNN